MKPILAFLRQEAVLGAGVVLSGVEASVASGSTLQVALQGAAPLALSAIVRSLQSPTTTTKEADMADLTALKQAVADLATAVTNAQSYVTTLHNEATPQTDVDAVTSQVQQLTAQVPVAPAPVA